jgi:hypothetical protein
MRSMFDLGSYDHVKKHAGAILETVENGSMPCNQRWTPEQVPSSRAGSTTGALSKRTCAPRTHGRYGRCQYATRLRRAPPRTSSTARPAARSTTSH